ncbi:MAG: ABC transporter substrate-binding protein [Waterburya sp.]
MIEKLLRYCVVAIAIIILVIACNSDTQLNNTQIEKLRSPSEPNVLQILWEKGFNPDEDKALQTLFSNWEQESGKKIKHLFGGSDELSKKVERTILAGDVPDLLATSKPEKAFIARLAWEGKLADVSDVIKLANNSYPKNILKAVSLYNKVEQKQSYYAVPLYQATVHVYYWRDLLHKAGFSDRDIPQDWDGFWKFWTKVQDQLRIKQNQNIYGLGLPVSVEAADTYQVFEHILEAHNISLVNSQGQLQVNNPQIRQGIIQIFNWYKQLYEQGYIPPEALHWSNPDNNQYFLNRLVLMTPNQTLSIPAAVRQVSDTYGSKLAMIDLPKKPNGQPISHLTVAEQIVLFAESPHHQLAKNFLAYISQPKVMEKYLKASGNRFFPVQKTIWQTPFWQNSQDVYISTVTKTLTQKPTRSYHTVQNPVYGNVLQENVWGKALQRVLVDNVSSEQAADEAIARIKEIFAEWK